jgi:HAD superfamily hydrolase (TIGR01549 family)
MLQAVLFDLGGTLWDDYPSELAHWETLVGILASHAIETDLDALITQSRESIRSFCPSMTRAIIWHFCAGQRALYDAVVAELVRGMLERLHDPAEFRRLNPLFPGVPELLERLVARYPLAIVSQNFGEAEEWMGYHGIQEFFQYISLSSSVKLYKPDPRLYVRTCNLLGIESGDAMMVGDRLDNDIWPANRLGMTSVRVLAEPYRSQQPRYHCDAPDYTLERITELPAVTGLLD